MLYLLSLVFSRPKAAILYDLTEKRILFANNIHTKTCPASLTKKMTLYLLFQALKNKKITLNTKMKISKNAIRIPYGLYLKAGDSITVRQAIDAMIIRSCNPSTVVVAEHLAGSVPVFVARMNDTAKKLNLKNTRFSNTHGLDHAGQKTTAWDMAKLACALYRNFPQYRSYFKKKKFQYKGQVVHTHNRVLNIPAGGFVGMKTGYTCGAGFNLTSVCVRKDKRGKSHHVVSVLLGEDNARVRDVKTDRLVSRFFKKV